MINGRKIMKTLICKIPPTLPLPKGGIIPLFTTPWPAVIRKGGYNMESGEIKEENRKIRFLRTLVDLSILSIQEEDLPFEGALKIVEDVRTAALNLFPGKEEAFELIYWPRFHRIIGAKFGPSQHQEEHKFTG
jgi:hypothetical protein